MPATLITIDWIAKLSEPNMILAQKAASTKQKFIKYL